MADPIIRVLCSREEYRRRFFERVCSDDIALLAGIAYKRPSTFDDWLRYFEESGQKAEFEATHELRVGESDPFENR